MWHCHPGILTILSSTVQEEDTLSQAGQNSENHFYRNPEDRFYRKIENSQHKTFYRKSRNRGTKRENRLKFWPGRQQPCLPPLAHLQDQKGRERGKPPCTLKWKKSTRIKVGRPKPQSKEKIVIKDTKAKKKEESPSRHPSPMNGEARRHPPGEKEWKCWTQRPLYRMLRQFYRKLRIL